MLLVLLFAPAAALAAVAATAVCCCCRDRGGFARHYVVVRCSWVFACIEAKRLLPTNLFKPRGLHLTNQHLLPHLGAFRGPPNRGGGPRGRICHPEGASRAVPSQAADKSGDEGVPKEAATTAAPAAVAGEEGPREVSCSTDDEQQKQQQQQQLAREGLPKKRRIFLGHDCVIDYLPTQAADTPETATTAATAEAAAAAATKPSSAEAAAAAATKPSSPPAEERVTTSPPPSTLPTLSLTGRASPLSRSHATAAAAARPSPLSAAAIQQAAAPAAATAAAAAAGAAAMTPPTTERRTGVADCRRPDFVSSFFEHSRLHFIGVWQGRCAAMLSRLLSSSSNQQQQQQQQQRFQWVDASASSRELQPLLLPLGLTLPPESDIAAAANCWVLLQSPTSATAAAAAAAAAGEGRWILHVDFDAFFVSVALLKHPHLRDQPVRPPCCCCFCSLLLLHALLLFAAAAVTSGHRLCRQAAAMLLLCCCYCSLLRVFASIGAAASAAVAAGGGMPLKRRPTPQILTYERRRHQTLPTPSDCWKEAGMITCMSQGAVAAACCFRCRQCLCCWCCCCKQFVCLWASVSPHVL